MKIAPRPPQQVMRLARMGSAHPTRLSFMRTLLRRLKAENWRFDRPVWEIDDKGVGRAVYRAIGPRRAYSLVAFAHDLPDEMRSDRVIATAWDATFTLFDGTPDADDLARLAENVPKQEAGRVSDTELSLSRANRSVRLWSHVVERLAAGAQPDAALIESVGYLMRTTAVYGSGKFGAADREALVGREIMSAPFHVEMLSVWLTRAFTLDLVEHMAAVRGGAAAARIEPGLRRRFGVGNSTGLGMAPFVVNHPALLHAWINARETALARVRALPEADAGTRKRFADLAARARLNVGRWHSDHPHQTAKLEALRGDMTALTAHLATDPLAGREPWDRLYRWGEANLSVEGQEQLAALLLEPHGALIDDLALSMAADEYDAFRIDGSMPLARLRQLVARDYDWALTPDYAGADDCARFWYVSEEKLEPRLGQRHEEPGAELEQPLATGRDIAALAAYLERCAGKEEDVADFLAAHPEHRHSVRRVQIAATRPYAEIRDNLIASEMLPIDILRCKLSFFGANRFDPRSDRWVRICMYQNAPFPHELAECCAENWAYPTDDLTP